VPYWRRGALVYKRQPTSRIFGIGEVCRALGNRTTQQHHRPVLAALAGRPGQLWGTQSIYRVHYRFRMWCLPLLLNRRRLHHIDPGRVGAPRCFASLRISSENSAIPPQLPPDRDSLGGQRSAPVFVPPALLRISRERYARPGPKTMRSHG